MSTEESTARRAEDEAVLAAARSGETGAFDRFVGRFGNRIYAFGLRMCGRPEDAEDVVQETLLTVFRKLHQLERPGALRAWLYRIVANACLGHRRRHGHGRRELSLEEVWPDPGRDAAPRAPEGGAPDEELHREELAVALEQAARDLPPENRIVWMMRDVEGLTTEETAQALAISVPAVKMRLHRARLALRRQLTPLRPEGGPTT